MLKTWVVVLVVVWILQLCHTQSDSLASSSCQISANSQSDYVVAYTMEYQPGRGCYSNSSTPSHRHVHVISLLEGNSHKSFVHLQIELKNSSQEKPLPGGSDRVELYERQLVFVLNSLHPIRWTVEVSRRFLAHTRQLFVIPDHSSIKFKKRGSQVHMRSRNMTAMPSPAEERSFLLWVRHRFKAVTSYSELEGDRLLFYVGQSTADSTGSDCQLNKMKPSPCAFAARMEQQVISSCISRGAQNVVDRPVYIIEFLGLPQTQEVRGRQIEVDIMASNGQKLEHDFHLVLRSPHPVKWVLRSLRIQGWIDVVTDSDVDSDVDLHGIRMHTVALRRDVMRKTGAELISWVEYYVAPVRAYAAVTSANIIHLLLPSKGSKKGSNFLPQPHSSLEVHGKGSNPELQKESSSNADSADDSAILKHLKHIIKTRCDAGMMEVTLPTFLTQEMGLPVEHLSLLDGSCRATKNKTHVILRTALDQCQTRQIIVDNNYVYCNAIVIHASGTGVVGAILVEELGSGYFDLQAASGSGGSEEEDPDATFLDDEDLQSQTVQIDVKCQMSRNTESQEQVTEADVDSEINQCSMQMYEDPFFSRQVVHFPFTANSFSGIYLLATTPSDSERHVLIENCWVTKFQDPNVPDPEQIILVHKGCVQSSAQWVDLDKIASHAHSGESAPERLRISRVLPHGSFLHCQVSTCKKATTPSDQKCPPHAHERCNSNLLQNIYPHLETHMCGVYSLGPVEITDKEMRIYADRGVSTQPALSPTKTRAKPVVGQASHEQPQQSVIIEGLDSGTVIGIAFAAFAIGILLTGTLWFIHTHTGPSKRGISSISMVAASGDVTPSSPVSA